MRELSSPFVEVSAALRKIVGEPLPGTRMYRKEGAEDHIRDWEDVIFKEFGPCVSPGGRGAESRCVTRRCS